MSNQTPQPETVDRITAIIRRDLMLGPDADLAAETALFGSDFDLDSLDALLLMQSVEREFGFKVPSEAFGPEVFKNVGSLASFVETQGATDRRSSPA